MKHTLLGIALLLTALATPLAADANTYKVTPLIIDREVEARDIFSETITITNNKNHKIRVYPSVNEVAVDEGGDITSFVPPSMADGAKTVTSWLSISRAKQEVNPGETITIPLHVKVHPEAEPGVYHAVIGFGSGSNRPSAEAQVKNGQAPKVIVTLKVDQDQTEFLKLDRFMVDRFVTGPENDAVHYTLNNPGEAPIVPTGEVIFYNSRGEEVAAVPVNPNKDSLAPGQETTYSTAAPTDDMFGKYKAFLTVDYGTEQVASVYDTVFFYVMPWQKLLIVFSVLLIFAVGLTVFLHRRYGADDEYEDDADHVPMFVRETASEDKDHDINLKQK